MASTLSKVKSKLGTVAHSYNPRLRRLREEFKASPGHLVRPCFKKERKKREKGFPRFHMMEAKNCFPLVFLEQKEDRIAVLRQLSGCLCLSLSLPL